MSSIVDDDDDWDIRPSDTSLRYASRLENSPLYKAFRTKNPIRAIVDNMKAGPAEEKELISLSIGKIV